jgi:MFS family permease
VWSFGLGLYNYVWPLFLQDLSADPGQVGIVFAIGFLAAAVSMFPGGILANKYELRALLIAGWALSIPPPLLYYFAGNWTDVIPGMIIFQVSAFNIPAFNAYIAGATDKSRTGSSFGIVWASFPLGFVFSPAIGGLLLTWITIREIFLLSFVLFTVSTIILFWIRRQPPVKTSGPSFSLELPKNRAEIVLLVFLTGAAIAYSIASPSAFVPLFFHDVLSLSPTAIQILGSIQSLGQTAFAFLLGSRADVRSRGRTMALGIIVSATGIVGIVLTRNLLLVFPLMFLLGSARASSYIAYSILAFIRSGASRAGGYGFYLTLENLGFMAGSYIGGFLYSISPMDGFVVAAFSFLALALMVGVTNFRTRGSAGATIEKSSVGQVAS